jgi:hypothetical protein
MHRLLIPGTHEVDHKNGDGLDNRRSTNLRPATHQQNNANRAKARGSSRFKGVSWDRPSRRWYASIRGEGRSRNLGKFDSEVAAARAYNAAAVKFFGEYARLNIIDEEGACPLPGSTL